MQAPPNVALVGRVPAADAFLRSCRIVALSSRAGTGVQLKTVEAMRARPARSRDAALLPRLHGAPGQFHACRHAGRFREGARRAIGRDRRGRPAAHRRRTPSWPASAQQLARDAGPRAPRGGGGLKPPPGCAAPPVQPGQCLCRGACAALRRWMAPEDKIRLGHVAARRWSRAMDEDQQTGRRSRSGLEEAPAWQEPAAPSSSSPGPLTSSTRPSFFENHLMVRPPASPGRRLAQAAKALVARRGAHPRGSVFAALGDAGLCGDGRRHQACRPGHSARAGPADPAGDQQR